MITTNNTNMPEFLRAWADEKNNGHSVPSLGKASTTFLLKDPTFCVLSLRHCNEITMDLQDTASQNTGTALHESVLKKAEEFGYRIEQNLEWMLEYGGAGFVLSGQIDGYSPTERILLDLKFSKLAIYNKNKSLEDTEWFDQLSVYYFLLNAINPEWFNGIDRIFNLVNIKDISKVKEAKAGNPTDQWRIIEWNVNKVAENVQVALAKIKNNWSKICMLSYVPEDKLPICSDKFRYADKLYKIYKRKAKGSEETNKTAVSGHAKYETMDDAVKGFDNAGFTLENYVIKEVGGESIKCEYYCEHKAYCPHYMAMKEKANEV